MVKNVSDNFTGSDIVAANDVDCSTNLICKGNCDMIESIEQKLVNITKTVSEKNQSNYEE